MPVLDFYASQGHYAVHLAPLWRALVAERGTFWCSEQAAPRVRRLGLDYRVGQPERCEMMAAAAAVDLRVGGDGPVIFIEHGAGQAYDVANPSYSGGPGRDRAVLFLCPNEVVAARNAARYPEAVVEIVGSPRVEALRASAASRDGGRFDASGAPPAVVALSFHWNCKVAPEARWAYDHYRAVLPALVERFEVVGHGHPRFAGFFERLWRQLGVPYVPDFEDLPAVADVYACDNSSTLFEWAALGRPVVVMNCPHYRRDVDLFPRFWRCADVGVQVDQPGDLAAAVAGAIADSPERRTAREVAVRTVFGEVTGSTRRAADAVRRTVSALASLA